MKQSIRIFLLTALIALILTIVFADNAFSQPPPPPPPQVGHGATGNVPGAGGAPVGEGIWILISLAFSYCVFYYMRRNENSLAEPETGNLQVAAADVANREETNDSKIKAKAEISNKIKNKPYLRNNKFLPSLLRRISETQTTHLKTTAGINNGI